MKQKLFSILCCLLLYVGMSILKAETASFTNYSNIQVSTKNLDNLGLFIIAAGTFKNGTIQTTSSYALIGVHASTGKYQTSNNTPYAGFYTVTNKTQATLLEDGQMWGYDGSTFNTYYAKVSSNWFGGSTTTPYNLLACTVRIQKNSSGNVYIKYTGPSYNNGGIAYNSDLVLTIGSGTVYTLNNATEPATDVIVGGGSVTVNSVNTIFDGYSNADGYSARISVATTSTGNFSASQFNSHNMSTWLKRNGTIIEINDIRGSITTVNGLKYFDVELVDYAGHKYHVTNIKQLEKGVITATCNPSYGSVSGIVLDNNAKFVSGTEYPAGTRIEITAKPIKGYLFTRWNDDNLNNPRTIIVDGPKNITAQFEQGVEVYLEEGSARAQSNWCEVSGSNDDYSFSFNFDEAFSEGVKNYTTMDNSTTNYSWIQATGGTKKKIQNGYVVSINYNSMFRRAILDATCQDEDGLKYKVKIVTNKLGNAYMYNDVEQSGKSAMGNNNITFDYSEAEITKTDTYIQIYVNRSVPDDYCSTNYQAALLFNISGDKISGVYPILGTANPGTMTVGGYNSNDGLAGSWGYFDNCTMGELGTGKWLFRSGEVTLRWKDASHYYIEVNAYGSTGNNVKFKIGNAADVPVAPTYALSWDANGGELSGSYTAAGSYEEGEIIKAPTANNDGYNFSKWRDVTKKVDFSGTMPANDVTYTAQWNRIEYTITYNGLEDATNSNPPSYNVETETFTLANPGKRDGYIFAGWKDKSDNTITQIAKGSTGDLTLTATWNVKSSNIELCENCDNAYYNTFKDNYNNEKVNVTYNRQFTASRWSTMCLPFSLDLATMITHKMSGCVYEFKYATGNANVGSGVNLYFSNAKSIEAGKCYIVNANAELAAKTSFVFSGVTIDLSKDNGAALDSEDAYAGLPGYNSQGTIELVGTLRNGTLQGSATGNKYMGLKENKIYYPNTTAPGSTIWAYRGIFRSSEILDKESMQKMRIIVDGEDRGELIIDADGDILAPSDAQSRKFIRDGVLYIEREGVVYDAQGKRVEGM